MAPNSVAKGSWRRVEHRSEEPILMDIVFCEMKMTSMGGICSLTFPVPLGQEEGAIKFIQLDHMGSQTAPLSSHQNRFQMA